MPAYLLLAESSPQAEVVVIDATSAPGNKTSYVSGTLAANASAQVCRLISYGDVFADKVLRSLHVSETQPAIRLCRRCYARQAAEVCVGIQIASNVR